MKSWSPLVMMVTLALAMTGSLGASIANASPTPRLSGIEVLQGSSYGFAEPNEIYPVGGMLWISNLDANRVTVINGTSGTVYKTLPSGKDRLWVDPRIAVQGSDVWTLGYSGGSFYPNLFVELNGSTGAVIRSTKVVANPISLQLQSTESMVASGNDLWLAVATTLYEFNGMTGKVLRSSANHLVTSSAMVLAHGDVWAFNTDGTLSEFASSTCKFIRSVSLSGAQAGTGGYPPEAMAVSGTTLWVPAGTEAFRVSTSSGGILSRLKGASFGFNKAMWVATTKNRVWVVNLAGESLTELVQSTGALVKIDKGKPYDFIDPQAAAIFGGSLWVTNSHQLHQGGAGQVGSVTVLPAS
jgi:hypothetical protein